MHGTIDSNWNSDTIEIATLIRAYTICYKLEECMASWTGIVYLVTYKIIYLPYLMTQHYDFFIINRHQEKCYNKPPI